ncbi:MAG: hypothetical protein IJV62_01365, partial [Eggerthellaceae bacterium]|nr:hypothetical protein [Eggerthellaceae bacterium]
SDQVIKGMQIKVPEMLSDSEFIGTTGTWFTSPSHGYFVSDSSKSPFNIVDGAFSGAIHNAHSAIAESSSSVGGSFGSSGGFSSGGGGGFGGGGGGAR